MRWEQAGVHWLSVGWLAVRWLPTHVSLWWVGYVCIWHEWRSHCGGHILGAGGKLGRLSLLGGWLCGVSSEFWLLEIFCGKVGCF